MVRGIEIKASPNLIYGPNLPTATITSIPLYSPKVRGSLNKSRASSKVMVSILWFLLKLANFGFSSEPSIVSPICAKGPKRPTRTDTGFPLAGSTPNIFSPLARSLFSDVVSTVL